MEKNSQLKHRPAKKRLAEVDGWWISTSGERLETTGEVHVTNQIVSETKKLDGCDVFLHQLRAKTP